MLRREIVALRREVERLRDVPRTGVAKSDPRAADAHRLAYETAEALDRVLHNEVLVWQAIDGLKAEVARVAARAEPVTSGAIVNAE